MLGRLDLRAKEGDANGERSAARDVRPGRGRGVGIGRAELLPAERGPERPAPEDGQRGVEKQKDKQKPKDVRADRHVRAILKELLQFFLAEMLACREVNDQPDLNGENAAKSEYAEEKQMKPGPRDAEIFGQEGIGRRCGRNGFRQTDGN